MLRPQPRTPNPEQLELFISLLSSGLGEVMAPGILVTALTVTPKAAVAVDAGALHGRSALESHVEFVREKQLIAGGQSHWIVWVALELDSGNQPVRYRGLTVSELVLDPGRRVGYKSVAGQVNRISEAMRGTVRTEGLPPPARAAVCARLQAISREVWGHSSPEFRRALEPPQQFQPSDQ